MPELPEVETARLGLEQLILGKTIADVEVRWSSIIHTEEPINQWVQHLIGEKIIAIRRRAKYLIFEFTQGLLVVHLRMEGKFEFDAQAQMIPRKHVHVIVTFTDHSRLFYDDVRKFGRFEWIERDFEVDYFMNKKLGPEPTAETFGLREFVHGLSKTGRAIKPVLLDQKLVVGLGNIYVDESLFKARIHPTTPANQLKFSEVEKLHQAIIEVLQQAVEAGGSTIRTYRNSLGEAGKFQTALAVYGRTDEPCVECGHLIRKMKLSGRGTHYCAICQGEPIK